MPRDVSFSDSKCWNGGQKSIKKTLEWMGKDDFLVISALIATDPIPLFDLEPLM